MGKVKCANCGYLSLLTATTRQLAEVDAAIRDEGKLPLEKHDGQFHRIFLKNPICFVAAYPLGIEKPAERHGHEHDWFLSVIHDERDCHQFTHWLQGYTPKEHYEMIQEAQRLKWQTERELADKADRNKRDQEARDFQAEQAKQSRLHQNRSLTVSVVAVTVAIVGLIANNVLSLLRQPAPIIVNPAITVQRPAAVEPKAEPKQLPAPPAVQPAAPTPKLTPPAVAPKK
jgi:hypothetical protein